MSEETSETRGRQLTLDLQWRPRLLVDADSLGHATRVRVEGFDALTTTELGLDQDALDSEVVRTAKVGGRAVMTSDRAIHYDAFKQAGATIDNIVCVPQRFSGNLDLLAAQPSQTAFGVGGQWTTIWNFRNPSAPNQYTLQIPPKVVYPLLRRLDSQGWLTTDEMARIWECSARTAWGRARKLAAENWLYIAARKRSALYVPGEKLIAFRMRIP
jgi:hypothetical protein